MLDHFALFLLMSAGHVWLDPATDAHSTVQLHLQVSGRATPDCTTRMLTLPISSDGVIRAEIGGVLYDGRETSNRLLVLRSNEARPLALSGNEATGGRWSQGIDGRCVGIWKLAP